LQSAKRQEVADIIEALEALNPLQQPTQHLDQLAGKWVLLYTTITITVRHRIQLASQGDGWALSYASDMHLGQLAGKWVLLCVTNTIMVRTPATDGNRNTQLACTGSHAIGSMHQLAGKWVLLYTTITITVRRSVTKDK
jgi:hypothetical protein